MDKKEKQQITEIDGVLYVPYIILEASETRHAKERKNIIIAFLVAIVLIIGIVFWYENQFTTVDEISTTKQEYVYSQDGQGFNNINTGMQGDINGAEVSNNENKNNEKTNTP